MKNTAWVDTGFLVALFARRDKHHDSAVAYLRENATLQLHSLWPVIVEACFFLDNTGKRNLLTWLERGAMTMHEITTQDIPAIAKTIEKYANIDPDFTDAALVTLAQQKKIYRIVTVDKRDFSVYRAGEGEHFVRLWL